MLRKYLLILYFYLQKTLTLFLLVLGKILVRIKILRNFGKDYDWNIGVTEIAGMLSTLSEIVPRSKSINISRHVFDYGTYSIQRRFDRNTSLGLLINLVAGPFEFVKAILSCKGFIYLGSEGYLYSDVDCRFFEFSILHKYRKTIVCILTGSDIRSLKLMSENQEQTLIENFATPLVLAYPNLLSSERERVIRKRCEVINQFSNLIYSIPNDQKSYLKEHEFFPYILKDSLFEYDNSKYLNLDLIRIAHAPSSPIAKGTMLIRSAIKRLKNEGFNVEYIEIRNKSNSETLKILSDSHIVINELYAYVPGILGIEALAKNCVLITRASLALEPSMPGNPDDAWVSSESFEIYDKIRHLLCNKSLLVEQANRGFLWAILNTSESIAGKKFCEKINSYLS